MRIRANPEAPDPEAIAADEWVVESGRRGTKVEVKYDRIFREWKVEEIPEWWQFWRAFEFSKTIGRGATRDAAIADAKRVLDQGDTRETMRL